jgi:RHS repeat-associated protein
MMTCEAGRRYSAAWLYCGFGFSTYWLGFALLAKFNNTFRFFYIIKGDRVARFLLCALFFVLWTPSVVAQSMSWGEDYAKVVRGRELVESLTDASFGDQVSLYDGSTRFAVTDVSVPGNNALPVAFSRTWDLQNHGLSQQVVADWSIDVPNLNGIFAGSNGWPAQRCTQAAAPPTITSGSPPNYLVLHARQYWNGYRLEVPGSTGGLLLAKSSDPKLRLPAASLGAVSPWTTKDGWYFACLPSVRRGQGEGFIGFSPDGKKYTFDWIVEDTHRAIPKRGFQPDFYFIVQRKLVRIYATKVEDRFGNWVQYEWLGDRLQRIYSSDGRQISLAYDAAQRLSTVSTNGRVWTYRYQVYGNPQVDSHYLSEVVLPDGSAWRYDASQFIRRIVYKKGTIDDPNRDGEGFILRNSGYCNFDRVFSGGGGIYSVTHPSGARARYAFSPMRHGRKNVPENCMDTGDTPRGASNFYPLHHDALTVTEKTVDGAGLPTLSYQYVYSGIDPGYAMTGDPTHNQIINATPVPNYKTVKVVGPDGTEVTHVFGRDYDLNEGRLFRVETRKSGVLYESLVNEYLPESEVPSQNFPGRAGNSLLVTDSWMMSSAIRPVNFTRITRDGVNFDYRVSIFDAFARPASITKSSSLGFARSEVIEYYDDLDLWVIGLERRRTSLNSGPNGEIPSSSMIVSEIEYSPLAQPWKVYSFGKHQQTLTYNPEGTIATIMDGSGNAVALLNWKRGIPQLIRHPATPEAPQGATESATVDDNGWITSVTDEVDAVTGYGYDAMGRLASIVPPIGDSLASPSAGGNYYSTTRNFRALNASDWKPAGVLDGQWRLYEETGNSATITYMDALWRPVLKHEYDAQNVGPSLRASKTRYDTSGRVSFQSFPSSDVVPGETGIRTFYDALDRVTRVEQDSEHGVIATTTQYLPGLKTLVTNPKGLSTTTSFMAWDQPAYDFPILSEQPEGKVIQIGRHPQFGWPLSLTQRNSTSTLSATRRYVYQANGLLCKTIEPEIGATVYGYDYAGNLTKSASGLQDFNDINACNHAEAWASGRAVDRVYDARNRLTHLIFPNGLGNQIWTYEKDSLPKSVTAYNNAGNATPVITTYAYNNRRLLVGETLAQPGWYSWSVGYAYDGYGHLSTQTYPTGLVVDYAPNPLGQPTKAGTYASGAQYYPNGALIQFTYGNGIVHTMIQNARQLPARSTSSSNALDLGYFYDNNGNVTHIADHGRGSHFHRWMEYDNLDRLTGAGSVNFGGDHWHRMTYDALDNLKSWKLAGVKDYAEYVYDAQNHRLTSIRNTAGATVVGFAYDPQGNLQNKNGQGYQFDFGNRLRDVAGKENYRYDGLGRRVLAWQYPTPAKPSGTVTLSQYTQSGQIIYQEDHDRSTAMEHIYLAGSIIATREPNWATGQVGLKYQHTDALGSPVAVTNASGQVIERMDYEPWGVIIGKPNHNGIGYTGHVMDGATGLTYMQQRYYDQSVGRFISVDPVTAYDGNIRHFNRYLYAYGNPYLYSDPDGRAPPGCGDGSCPSVWENFKFGFTMGVVSGAIDGGYYSNGAGLSYNTGFTIARGLVTAGKSHGSSRGAIRMPAMRMATKQNAVVTSVNARAEALADKAGANSVSIRTSSGLVRYDLRGKSHHSKTTQSAVPTPHVQEYENRIIPSGPRAGQVGSVTSSGDVRPATHQDLRIVERALEKRKKP